MKNMLCCTLLIVLFFCATAAYAAPVTGVTLDEQSITMEMGVWNFLRWLTATVAPVNAANKNVTWSSSNPAVATVSNYGAVEAIRVGTTDITVTTEDGGFTDTCTVVVEERGQRAHPRYSQNKSEAALKTSGFSESDFEIVDGNVVIKRSIAETIAKKLLGTDSIEVTLLPWFEAEVQSGKIAAVDFMVTRSTLKLDEPSSALVETLLLNIISPNAGEFLRYTTTDYEFDDGEFRLFQAAPPPEAGFNFPNDLDCQLMVFIRDGGRFDISKTENGLVVGQLAIVGKAEKSEKSGGCNAGYGSILLFLFGFEFLLMQKNLCRKEV